MDGIDKLKDKYKKLSLEQMGERDTAAVAHLAAEETSGFAQMTVRLPRALDALLMDRSLELSRQKRKRVSKSELVVQAVAEWCAAPLK